MVGGKAHGVNRKYQEVCRDVLIFRDTSFSPWAGDGIDVAFDLPDTRWTFSIALRNISGALLVAECRRTQGAIKQEEIAAFAYKVELLRKNLNILVAGVFFAKRSHQIGAVKVGQFNGISISVLTEGSTLPGFAISFLRYDTERERCAKDVTIHVPPAVVRAAGSLSTMVTRQVKPDIPKD